MRAPSRSLPLSALPRAQRGLSLLFVIMALVVMGFAAVGLARSVETGALIVGNLSFKRDATAATSTGAEMAISWLQGKVTGSSLNANDTVNGYYAASTDDLDATGNRGSGTSVAWSGTCAAGSTCAMPFTSPTRVNGNTVQWVITRLCQNAGEPSTSNPCVRPAVAPLPSISDRSEVGPGGRITVASTTPLFRVIVRVEGPRNTVSFTETLVHF